MRAPLPGLCLLLIGCYAVPDPPLPPYEGVPIESTDFACAPARTELVACTIDGDTFDVGQCGNDAERVRLLGIDAPETAKEDSPADCYGPEAEDALRDVLEGKEVFLEFDDTCEGAFGRTLAWVFLLPTEENVEDEPVLFPDEDASDPVNLSVWMAEQGYARLFEEFEFESLRYADDLEEAAGYAEQRGFGLWGACGG